MARLTNKDLVDKNPFEKIESTLNVNDVETLIGINKSGQSLLLFLIENGSNFLSHDGIAYLNVAMMKPYMGKDVRAIYYGIRELINKGLLVPSTNPGEYFYNYKFFPKEK